MALLTGFELKEFNAASLSGSYQNLGAVLSNPAYYIDITNDSDVDVYISTDGSTNEIRVNSGFSQPIPFYSRHNTLNLGSVVLAKGAQISIKQVTAAGTGSIVVNVLTVR